MSNRDHYQLLDVARNADRRTIRAAYRKALRRHHPDVNAGNREGEHLLLQIITAGRVLCDPQQRARYDQQFKERSQQPPNQPLTKKPQKRVAYRKFLLECKKILHTGKLACLKFFNEEQANATEARAARQKKRTPPGFNFYLHLAMSRKGVCQYQQDADGIYRKTSPLSRHTKLRTWRKRTAVWLLIGILLWRG